MLTSVDQIIKDFKNKGEYIGTTEIALAIMLAYKLEKPLLVEGEPGVGKTELAKVVANILDRSLIRLQCYEGIDETHILYEWAYAKQLLYAEILRSKINEVIEPTTSLKDAVKKIHQEKEAFFSREFLQTRPLLQALTSESPVVLLIDEIDRSDRETEAFLLEALSDFQISIPELTTITAKHKPFVLLTSNNTRDLSDALKRRCIYLYIDLPTFEQEMAIIQLKVPQLKDELTHQIVDYVQKLRQKEWRKPPSISESIDWAMALITLNVDYIDIDIAVQTMNLLLKNKEDCKKATRIIPSLIKPQAIIESG